MTIPQKSKPERQLKTGTISNSRSRPGAGPSSAMVTRSRARGGRDINIEPEVEFFPEVEIPAETDEEGSGAGHITDIASQYIPEVAITQEVTTSASITTSSPPIPRNLPPHNRTSIGSRMRSIESTGDISNDLE